MEARAAEGPLRAELAPASRRLELGTLIDEPEGTLIIVVDVDRLKVPFLLVRSQVLEADPKVIQLILRVRSLLMKKGSFCDGQLVFT